MVEQKVSLLQTAYILFKNRKVIVVSTLGAIAVAAAISLVLPKWYKARASILPPESATSQADIIGIMKRVGYQPAMIPTVTSPSEIYSAVLESYRVTNAVIDSLNLIDAYKGGSRAKTVNRIKKYRSVGVSREGIVEIEYEDKDPERAAEVANALVRELDLFNREVRGTTAKRVREFIEQRIEQTMAELDTAEAELKAFKESTGAVLISEQTKASIETAAEIYARIAELEVSLERLGAFATDKSPEVIDIRSQIRALERKLAEMGYMKPAADQGNDSRLFPSFANAPALEKRLAELMRNAEIKRAVYTVLSEQYEEAKIRETRDTPTLQVLDWAHPPTQRSRPRRKAIVAVSGAFAFLLSSFLVFSRERMHRSAQPEPENVLADISSMLQGDLRAIGTLLRERRRES